MFRSTSFELHYRRTGLREFNTNSIYAERRKTCVISAGLHNNSRTNLHNIYNFRYVRDEPIGMFVLSYQRPQTWIGLIASLFRRAIRKRNRNGSLPFGGGGGGWDAIETHKLYATRVPFRRSFVTRARESVRLLLVTASSFPESPLRTRTAKPWNFLTRARTNGKSVLISFGFSKISYAR